MRNQNHKIRINVSGRRFEIHENLLLKYPLTLLGKKTNTIFILCYNILILGDSQKRLEFFTKSRKEYYFDRNAETFEG